jgi:elongation factor Ts
MAEITAAMVKQLREETSQGMMECKKALEETKGDFEAAKDLLRKRGLVAAEKKAARTVSEGRVAISANAGRTEAAMVEIRCETDFCARNEVFQKMVESVGQLAIACPVGAIEATQPMKDAVQSALAKIGENMTYARGIKIAAKKIATYLHHNGKVGVIVGVDSDVPDATLADLCMHIAFADPVGILPSDIPAELVEREKKIAREQAIESGKPAEIAEKMVAGKIQKFLAANALMEQPFVRDDKKQVKDILGKATVTAFARYQVGAAS